jgi:gluconokinase
MQIRPANASFSSRGATRVVIMGVSGCGKSSLANALGAALGWQVVDADNLHTDASIAMMRQGVPLQDEHRWPWLKSVAAALEGDTIRAACPGVHFVFLDGPIDLVMSRLQGRAGHYMPTSLLQTQFDTLERPGPDETDVLTLSMAQSVPDMVAHVRVAIGLPSHLPCIS